LTKVPKGGEQLTGQRKVVGWEKEGDRGKTKIGKDVDNGREVGDGK
jgi:hypothetical protein